MSEMGNLEMIDIHLKADMPKSGWVRIWAVDEHGCVLHTEPVCTVPVDFHSWFIDWIEGMEPPMKVPSLLHHPIERDGMLSILVEKLVDIIAAVGIPRSWVIRYIRILRKIAE